MANNLPSESEKTFKPLANSKTYIITCVGPGGINSESVSVAVDAPVIIDSPTLTPTSTTQTLKTFSFSADKKLIQYNSSVILSWSAPNFSSCNASSEPYNNAWSDILSKSGEKEIKNLAENTIFTLNCESPDNSAKKSVSVTVGAALAPAITFSAEPSSISYNSSSILNWSVSNAEFCI